MAVQLFNKIKKKKKHLKNYVSLYFPHVIVHPESFRSNAQSVIVFARRNRPRVDRNYEFACIYLHWRAFACVCEYSSRSTACAYVRAYVLRTYIGKGGRDLGMALLVLIIYTRVRCLFAQIACAYIRSSVRKRAHIYAHAPVSA